MAEDGGKKDVILLSMSGKCIILKTLHFASCASPIKIHLCLFI